MDTIFTCDKSTLNPQDLAELREIYSSYPTGQLYCKFLSIPYRSLTESIQFTNGSTCVNSIRAIGSTTSQVSTTRGFVRFLDLLSSHCSWSKSVAVAAKWRYCISRYGGVAFTTVAMDGSNCQHHRPGLSSTTLCSHAPVLKTNVQEESQTALSTSPYDLFIVETN